MKFENKSLISALALAGFLSACGGGTESSPITSNKTSQYTGHVIDENGAPAPGISLRLENRTTDQTIETVTMSDGSFSAEVKPGMYDIIFDDVSAVKFTSLLKTAVDLRENKEDEVKLQAASKSAVNSLSGTLKNANGTPAAQRKILILPSIARSTAAVGDAVVPDPFIVQTDAEGNFSTLLGQAGMDFDFDALLIAPNAPELAISKLAADYDFTSKAEYNAFLEEWSEFLKKYAQESLDVEKPNGAMHLDLVIGADVRNLRSASGAPSVIPADAEQLIIYEKSISTTETISLESAWNAIKNTAASELLKLIPSAYADEISKKFYLTQVTTNENGKITTGHLIRGRVNITSGDGFTYFKDLILESPFANKYLDKYFKDYVGLRLKKVGQNNPASHRISIEIKHTNANGTYTFITADKQSFSTRFDRIFIRNNNTTQHINYQSENPEIIKIEFKLYKNH